MSKQNKPLSRRKEPTQDRSRDTVQAILEGAARVFRREGWNATTNRIANEAGVSIGTLYEYFPNKESLVVALACAHVDLAEKQFSEALRHHENSEAFLSALQTAVIASQKFPSPALTIVHDAEKIGPELRARADALRHRVLAGLAEHALARGCAEPALHARICFDLIGDLTARATFEDPANSPKLAKHYLELAVGHLRANSSVR